MQVYKTLVKKIMFYQKINPHIDFFPFSNNYSNQKNFVEKYTKLNRFKGIKNKK